MLILEIANTESVSFGAAFVKMMAAMILIIALAFVMIKIVLPLFMKMRRKSDSKIQVLDFQPLEPRKNIYLLRIEDKKVAVGVSENSVTKLCEWEYNEDK